MTQLMPSHCCLLTYTSDYINIRFPSAQATIVTLLSLRAELNHSSATFFPFLRAVCRAVLYYGCPIEKSDST
jgi:hypothetical protein